MECAIGTILRISSISMAISVSMHPPVGGFFHPHGALFTPSGREISFADAGMDCGASCAIPAVAFVIDATLSVRDALDLKKLLRSLTENNAAAVALKEKFGEISSGVVTMKEDFQKALREAEQEFAVRKWERRNERILRENGEPFLSLSERLRGYAQKVRLQSEAVRSAEEKTRLTELLQKLEELRKKTEKIESDFH